MHDVCMQNLHVIFAIDRAGLVGATERHIRDVLTFLSHDDAEHDRDGTKEWKGTEKMLSLQFMRQYRLRSVIPEAAYQGLEEFESPDPVWQK